jgi:hypothetical protein
MDELLFIVAKTGHENDQSYRKKTWVASRTPDITAHVQPKAY